MQPLREVVHPAVFAGEPLPEGARPDASVRLQGAPQQDVRVRGVWPHHRGAGEPLHPSQGITPVQSSIDEVLRQEIFQVPEQRQNHRCTYDGSPLAKISGYFTLRINYYGS